MLLYNVAVVAILVLAWTSLRLLLLAHTGLAAWCVAPVDANSRRETVLDEISPSSSMSGVGTTRTH